MRLDVYIKDEKGTVYNVEIQTAGSKNLARRTRYYQGMIDLNDGTTKIFFNTTETNGRVSKSVRNILEFIQWNTPEDDFTKRLEQEVHKIKENKEWKAEYMTLLMREREKYKEGKAEGKAEGIIGILLDQGHEDKDIISTLRKKLDIDKSQAEDYLKRFYDGSL